MFRRILITALAVCLPVGTAIASGTHSNCIQSMVISKTEMVGIPDDRTGGTLTLSEPATGNITMSIAVTGSFTESVSVFFPQGVVSRGFTINSSFLPSGGTITATVHNCTIENENGQFTGWADEKVQQITVHSPQVELALPKTEVTGSAVRQELPGTISQEDQIIADISSLTSDFGYTVTVASFDFENPVPLRFPFDSFDGSIFWLPQNSYTIKKTIYDGPFTIRGNDVTRETTAFVTIKYFTLSGIDLSPFAATFTITVKPKEEKWNLNAELVGTGTPSAEKLITPEQIPIINVPLGGRLRLRLSDQEGSTRASGFQIMGSTVSFPDLLSPRSLFPSNALVQLGTEAQGESAEFVAVHLGQTSIRITPRSSTKILNVDVNVYTPSTLNGTEHAWDPVILQLAHRHGILPQFYKAHFAKEGQNSATAWRYEPLNTELGDLGLSRGTNLRSKPPYTRYRLQTIGDAANPGTCQKYPDPNLRIPDSNCRGLMEGDLVKDDDLGAAVNAMFPIMVPERDPTTGAILTDSNGRPQTRRLQISDRSSYISARDLFDFNDRIYHWSTYAPRARIARLTFTAQPTLAASYGLMQMMYAMAIQLGWNPPGGRNPSLLLDTPENIANGGGSLEPGSLMLTEKFYTDFKNIAVSPTFKDYSDFESKFVLIYQKYDSGIPNYGTDVIVNRSPQFMPIPDQPLFSGDN